MSTPGEKVSSSKYWMNAILNFCRKDGLLIKMNEYVWISKNPDGLKMPPNTNVPPINNWKETK